MAPIVLIIIFGIIGFFIREVWGLFAGIGIGWLISMGIGTLASLISGGILPRKERRRVAVGFVKENEELVNLCLNNLNVDQKIKFIETYLEKIFRKASSNASQISKTMGMSPPEILDAINEITLSEKDENKKKLLYELAKHIFETMY